MIEHTSCVIRIGNSLFSFFLKKKGSSGDYLYLHTIVPTRSTSYSHLRDGFMRALQARLSAQKRQRLITDEQEAVCCFPIQKKDNH